MKVYVLLRGAAYEGFSFEGVFESVDAAKTSIKKEKPRWKKYRDGWQTLGRDPWYEIEEAEVQK